MTILEIKIIPKILEFYFFAHPGLIFFVDWFVTAFAIDRRQSTAISDSEQAQAQLSFFLGKQRMAIWGSCLYQSIWVAISSAAPNRSYSFLKLNFWCKNAFLTFPKLQYLISEACELFNVWFIENLLKSVTVRKRPDCSSFLFFAIHFDWILGTSNVEIFFQEKLKIFCFHFLVNFSIYFPWICLQKIA